MLVLTRREGEEIHLTPSKDIVYLVIRIQV